MQAVRSVCPTKFRPDVPIEPPEEIPLRQADGTRVAHCGSKFLSMGVGTQKIEGRFDVRNVTKPIVAAGQVTDRGQGKLRKLLGDKRGFVELRKQRGAYVIPCEGQSSNLFPLVRQEPKQGTQMDRGEVEVEEKRRARVKSAPVLPTDKERDREEHEVTHATFRSWCEACVAGRATEDSHKRSATEPSVPLVAMDYGFFGRDTDVGLATIPVLIQRPHGAVGACQVLRKGPEPHAIDCVLAYLDTWGLRKVLLKADNEPAVQALVDSVRVRRGDRTMARTYVCVLQEKLCYKVDSKCIVLPSHAAYVLSRFVKRDDGRSAWARLRGQGM